MQKCIVIMCMSASFVFVMVGLTDISIYVLFIPVCFYINLETFDTQTFIQPFSYLSEWVRPGKGRAAGI
uniref:Uncharacterized protein n=1 Tax=Anguilla anguilla TaxID=7936 RepID=A0A0E9WMH5_ANGAN